MSRKSDFDEVLRALNEAAYAALRAALRSEDPAADRLKAIAHEVDELVERAMA